MISHEHECIFVHIRRTGGNSVETALGGLVLLDENDQPTQSWRNDMHRGKDRYKIDRRGTKIHANAQEIEAQYPDEFRRYFKFSFVRNPWEQIFSLYRRMRPRQKPDASGLDAFIESMSIEDAATIPSRALVDGRGEWAMDFIGRFETLAEDFAEACTRMGCSPLPLPVHNTSEGTRYTRHYSQWAQKFVSERYAPDIERFGYRFGD